MSPGFIPVETKRSRSWLILLRVSFVTLLLVSIASVSLFILVCSLEIEIFFLLSASSFLFFSKFSCTRLSLIASSATIAEACKLSVSILNPSIIGVSSYTNGGLPISFLNLLICLFVLFIFLRNVVSNDLKASNL